MGRPTRRRRACLPGLGKKQLLHWDPDTSNVLELFPETARVEDGELTLGGVPAAELADEHGTPLLVYCERDDPKPAAGVPRGRARTRSSSTGRRRSRTSRCCGCSRRRASAPTSRRSASSRSRRRPGIPGERLVFHGNNKSEEELRAAAEAGALVVLDGPGEAEAAAAAGVRRVLVRLTPGVEAVTHRSIQTAHEESKFGLAPDAAEREVERARELGLEVEGLHVHVGSQLGAAGRERARARARPRVPRAAAAGRRASSTSAAGSASATTATRRCPRWRSSSGRSSSGCRTASS